MPDKKIYKTYTNGEIEISWEPHKCIHATTCWKELGSVFKPLKRPWVKPSGATTEKIIHQIEKCPSGALGYKYLDKTKEIMIDNNENHIVQLKVNKNGSMKVTGKVEILLPDGTREIKEGRFSICRCGLSANKPFCDGAHKGSNYDENWDVEVAPKEN